MSPGSLCVVFNNVDERSGIGKLCAWAVRTALSDGWRVSVVARDLAPDLRPDVEWLPLYVPPRLHAVQWYAAAPTVRRAMGGRTWDVVHVQQPQLVDLANLLQLHYIVRAARERSSAPTSAGTVRARLGAAQARATELGEDRCLRRLPQDLTVVGVSTFVLDEFVRLYGPHERSVVLSSPAPAAVALTPAERARARERLVGSRPSMVLGFLGGSDSRKGGRALLDALGTTHGVTVLWGGAGEIDHPVFRDRTRVLPVGHVSDVREFFAACDAFAAVSDFDPGPLTVLEAASHDVPVLGTLSCGFVKDLCDVGGAMPWQHGEPLGEVLTELSDRRRELVKAAGRLREVRASANQAKRLLSLYDDVASWAAKR